jgi:uncharacterized protein (DUF849 family)
MSLLKVHVHGRDASEVRDLKAAAAAAAAAAAEESEEDAAITTSAAGAESKYAAHSASAFDLTEARLALGPQPTAGQVRRISPEQVPAAWRVPCRCPQ